MKTSNLKTKKRVPKDFGWRVGNYYEIISSDDPERAYLGRVVKVGNGGYDLIHCDNRGTGIRRGSILWLTSPEKLTSRHLRKHQLTLWLITNGITLPKEFTEHEKNASGETPKYQ